MVTMRRAFIWVTVDLSPQDKSITDGQVYTTTYTYQNADSYLLKQISQSNGSVLTFEYKEVGGTTRLSKIDDNGSVTVLDYNEKRANGHQLKITDATGQYWYYQHDAQGRLIATLAPAVGAASAGTMAYQYDDQDNLVQVRDSEGKTIEHRYDAQGQLIEQRRNGVIEQTHEYQDAACGKSCVESRSAQSQYFLRL